jgi:hypothetical protein
VNPDDAARRLLAFPDVVEKASWGERAFFVNPGGVLASGAYFATCKLKDGPNDAASRLDARGAWRFNTMLKARVIPCLDVKDGRVVKGVNFVDLRDAGDPVEQARSMTRRAPTSSASSTSPPATRTAAPSSTSPAAPPSAASCR